MIALRLVQQNVSLFVRAQRLSVEGHAIAVEIDPMIGVLDDLAVDADAAGADPAPRVRARRHAGLREDAFESFDAPLFFTLRPLGHSPDHNGLGVRRRVRYLIRGARQLLTLRGSKSPRRGAALDDVGMIRDGALLIRDGLIVEVGPTRRVENLAAARGAERSTPPAAW